MVLDDDSKKRCTIATPWGSYKYKVLPMGIIVVSDVYQACLSQLLQYLPSILVYIDNITILCATSFAKLTTQICAVFTQLCNRNMQVNLLKSNWTQDKIDYLSFVLTQDGIKAQRSKVDTILLIAPPKNKKAPPIHLPD